MIGRRHKLSRDPRTGIYYVKVQVEKTWQQVLGESVAIRCTLQGLSASGGKSGTKRDETAAICRDKTGNPEPDPELRDTESVPLSESG